MDRRGFMKLLGGATAGAVMSSLEKSALVKGLQLFSPSSAHAATSETEENFNGTENIGETKYDNKVAPYLSNTKLYTSIDICYPNGNSRKLDNNIISLSASEFDYGRNKSQKKYPELILKSIAKRVEEERGKFTLMLSYGNAGPHMQGLYVKEKGLNSGARFTPDINTQFTRVKIFHPNLEIHNRQIDFYVNSKGGEMKEVKPFEKNPQRHVLNAGEVALESLEKVLGVKDIIDAFGKIALEEQDKIREERDRKIAEFLSEQVYLTKKNLLESGRKSLIKHIQDIPIHPQEYHVTDIINCPKEIGKLLVKRFYELKLSRKEENKNPFDIFFVEVNLALGDPSSQDIGFGEGRYMLPMVSLI